MRYLMQRTPQRESGDRKQKGFTLIELIMVLAIGAILLTQGIPSLITTIQNSQLTTETNKLVADINLIRSEAIKRGMNVVLCSSADPTLAPASVACNNSTTWTTGWLLFADDGNNAYDDGTDTLIRVGLPSESSVTFISTSSTLTYSSSGLNDDANTVAIAVCDDRGGNIGRQVQVNATGRPRLITGDSVTPVTCNAPVAM